MKHALTTILEITKKWIKEGKEVRREMIAVAERKCLIVWQTVIVQGGVAEGPKSGCSQ